MTPEEALAAIVKIIKDHKKLEAHQRRNKADVNTIVDSQSYAYDQIVEVMQPFMEA